MIANEYKSLCVYETKPKHRLYILANLFYLMIVTAAIIFKGEKILIAKRHHQWEFPGGRLEEDETMGECIVREIKEELNIDIAIIKKFLVVRNEEIELHVFMARYLEGEIKLNFHQDVKWVDLKELNEYEFLPLDKKIVERLLKTKPSISESKNLRKN
ncbi:MAG: (deoxy)nucleoside triphosphate pyrophosphohydrolase [Thermoplasmata archaeon]|nr:(deoxy)nucleoside triphosphate pyrophosphohydrolase [Thermoplasmata archaeon]